MRVKKCMGYAVVESKHKQQSTEWHNLTMMLRAILFPVKSMKRNRIMIMSVQVTIFKEDWHEKQIMLEKKF